MWIMGKRFNNRAVSQVIAALLLIAIAVAAAVLVYVFSIGLLGSLQGGGGQQVKQQLILEAYDWTTTLKLSLRNVGTAPVVIADVFVGGNPAVVGASTTVGIQSMTVMSFTSVSGLTPSPGVAYTIKIVTLDGAVFSYSAIYGQAS